MAQDGGGVAGELRELRRHYGRTLYRILYRRSRNLFILLHALRKNTGRIPAADIAVAQARWDDFKARMDAARRTPPRAAGHPMVRPLGRRAGSQGLDTPIWRRMLGTSGAVTPDAATRGRSCASGRANGETG